MFPLWLTVLGTFLLLIVGPIVFILFFIPIVYSSIRFSRQKAASPVRPEHCLPSKAVGALREDAEEIVVLLHGWPDDISMLYPVAQSLAESSHGKANKRRCLLVSIPDYPLPDAFDGDRGALPKNRRFGYSFDECVDLLRNTILKEITESKCKAHVIIGHDWGSIISALYVHKFACEARDGFKVRLVQLDAGFRTIKGGFALFFVAYQGVLNLLYLLPPWLGNPLTKSFAKRLGFKQTPGRCTPSQAMNWPYRAAFRESIWGGGTIQNLQVFRPKDAHLPRLFVFGEKNPVKLFDQRFLASVTRGAPDVSRVKGLPGNHWFFIPDPEPLIQVLEEWMVSSKDAVAPSKEN